MANGVLWPVRHVQRGHCQETADRVEKVSLPANPSLQYSLNGTLSSRGFQRMARVFMRLVFVSGTIHWVKIIGKQSKEAPIVVVAPHSSFFDSLVAVLFGPPSVVAKAETSCLPFFGSECLVGGSRLID